MKINIGFKKKYIYIYTYNIKFNKYVKLSRWEKMREREKHKSTKIPKKKNLEI